MKPVPVDVITGFLGAGKTTLLEHVLGGALAGERVAVVMNEIGEVSIDGRVIEGLDYIERMVELDGGCVCCTIDDFRFDMALAELVARADPTLILLETTGAADPDPVRERLARAGLPLDAVITVVDAAAAERTLAETAVARAQVRGADFLVLNKVDLVDAAALARLRRRLARLNDRALVVECERGKAPADVLFATAGRRYREREAAASAGGHARAGSPAGSAVPPDDCLPAVSPPSRATWSQPGTHRGEDRISSFTWRGRSQLDRARFERFLGRLPASVYRAKGVVRFADASWPCLFNYTCGRWELKWIQLGEFAGQAEAVFIGRDAHEARDAITRALEACEAR